MAKKKKRSSSLKKLTHKYRLVILNDETFEEQHSFKLSKFSLYVWGSSVLVLLIAIIVCAIFFTPLKYAIPGYGDEHVRSQLVDLRIKTDSLENVIYKRARWIENIKNVLNGELDTGVVLTDPVEPVYVDTSTLDSISEEDLNLRDEIENEQNYSLIFSNDSENEKKSLRDLHFMPPIEGYITADFDPHGDHHGIDIVAPEDEPIKSVLEGTVVSSSWTLKTGHVIAVQHENSLISFYKHNSVLLKKVGNFVKAGEVIAIIGSSGELTTGPHLHFELWHNGVALNPIEYISFLN